MKICPLCQREIPEDLESRHHLVPKLRGGTHGSTAILHQACHSKIHAVFTETELARNFDTIEKLLANEEIQTFVCWIQKRPIDFTDGTKSRRRQKRK
ncbi:MAG: 5-methylcytosine-specific restriction protein A [Verrucomicrobiales bacterium]